MVVAVETKSCSSDNGRHEPPPLPVARFVCELAADEALGGVAALGDRLHARLGPNLRRLVCSTGADDCAGCIAFDPCPYAALFASRPAGRTHRLLRGQQAPQPWVFSMPYGNGGIARGEVVELGLTAIGQAWRMLPYLLLALQRMPDRPERRGRPYWPLVPRRLRQLGRNGRARTIWQAGGKSIGDVRPPEPPRRGRRPGRVGDVGVRFETPVALKVRGQVLRRAPKLGELVRAAVRRVIGMGASWSDVELPADLRGLFALADQAEVGTAAVRPVRWVRDSRRQRGGVPMEGIIGRVCYTGVQPEVLPWLELGSLLHIGKGTAFGLGRIELERRSG